jgi:predicted GTPase
MSRWRVLVVMALILLPLVILMGVGTYHLWVNGWWLLVWWLLMVSIALGYLLGWYWQRKRILLRPPDPGPPRHWTERDQRAWALVQARAQTASTLSADKLGATAFYLETGQELAQELASFYHPGARDPVGNLTLPEILAVVELAAHDLAEMVDRYLPGGHLLTVNDWKRARQAVGWYSLGSKLYWAVATLFDPVNTGMRFAASQLGVSQPLQQLQNNLLQWFAVAYVHRVGTYLIEVHSGRLRVGATRYRSLLEQSQPEARRGDGRRPDGDPVDQVQTITLTLMGQVKAGKSSLANALLGEQRALTDVLPATQGVDRYELKIPGVPTRLILLDTIGYGHAGPREDQLNATRQAAQQSDLLLLVCHARNPARQADVQLLDGLRTWFASRPELKRPPTLAVLTHIDLLSPAMEWSPPYQWQTPTSAKEQNIHQAIQAAREQLGEGIQDLVPVCTAEGKVYGVEEGLLPAVVQRLDEVHAVALLRCLKAETDAGKVRKVFHQLLAVGKELARLAWEKV